MVIVLVCKMVVDFSVQFDDHSLHDHKPHSSHPDTLYIARYFWRDPLSPSFSYIIVASSCKLPQSSRYTFRSSPEGFYPLHRDTDIKSVLGRNCPLGFPAEGRVNQHIFTVLFQTFSFSNVRSAVLLLICPSFCLSICLFSDRKRVHLSIRLSIFIDPCLSIQRPI